MRGGSTILLIAIVACLLAFASAQTTPAETETFISTVTLTGTTEFTTITGSTTTVTEEATSIVETPTSAEPTATPAPSFPGADNEYPGVFSCVMSGDNEGM